MNYAELKKAELQEELKQRDQELKSVQLKVSELQEELDKAKRSLTICQTAREEDAENVKIAKGVQGSLAEAEKVHQLKQQELIGHIQSLQGQVQDQNQTLATVFEMMDKSLSQEIYYYQKFKGVFVAPPQPKGDEQ
jgi:chromosome segregation ATPase